MPLLLKWGTPSVLPSMRLVGEIARRELRCHISLQPSLRSRLGPWRGREGENTPLNPGENEGGEEQPLPLLCVP